MNIGLIGLDFDSNNLGCAALAYGFLELLRKAVINIDENVVLTVFDKCNISKVEKLFECRNFKIVLSKNYSIKSIIGFKKQICEYKKCDVIFDFTAGDSFSDIYGKKRFFARSLRKELIILSNTPLVLGSQTYGPFCDKIVKKCAKHIIRKSYRVYSRDVLSTKLVEKLTGISPIETVDVAFELPFTSSNIMSDGIIIGFNPSGLLWNGGYSGNNQFGLKYDYKEFCIKCIKMLEKINGVQIKLISHVRSNNLFSNDNDITACNELIEIFPELEKPKYFETPMEAKSFIAGLDVFIGSRMHATIASYTTGIPTIPVAYSRKFKGLFDSINYAYCIDCCNESLDQSLKKIRKYIMEREMISKSIRDNKKIIDAKKEFMEKSIEETLLTIKKRSVKQ